MSKLLVKRHVSLFIAVIAAALFLIATPAQAQSPFVPEAMGITAGHFNFDMSGTGSTPSIGFTADWRLSDRVLLDGGVLFVKPVQQIGRTTYIIPEAQVQYYWQLGRFMPFVGGGIGAGLDFRPEIYGGSEVDLVLSTGGGVRARLSESVGLRGELRLRGMEQDFAASAAEFRGGVYWNF